ncbi:MAG: hypothetical protein GY805_22800, partial [Chloroflexi bacterium]|nr:hypothetical protein [Chloroflexota bacterium]
PESYIDPTLRHNKTDIFKDLESKLQQQEVTVAAVETAYRKYLDEFTKLAKLKYVDAYYKTVDDELRGPVDTLFLFARTETQPYDYYFCKREYDSQWTAWQKIDQTINSRFVTPVYAFHRLFLFWVEIKKAKDNNIAGENITKTIFHQAAIKYTFFNLSQGWVQPQTLVDDTIINYGSKSVPSELEKDFDSQDPFWNKVYALLVEPGHYQTVEQRSGQREKIVIVYGPLSENDAASTQISGLTPANAADKGDEQKYAFDDKIYSRGTRYNRANEAKSNAYFPFNQVITLNEGLEHDFLVRNNESILLGKNTTDNVPFPVTPNVHHINARLDLVVSDSILRDNYFSDYTFGAGSALLPSRAQAGSFVSVFQNDSDWVNSSKQVYADLQAQGTIDDRGNVDPLFNNDTDMSSILGGDLKPEELEQLRQILFQLMGSPALMDAIAKRNSLIITVKNKPGSFILDNGDEAFLLEPKEKSFTQISDTLTVAPMVRSDSFVMTDSVTPANNIDAAASAQILEDLQANNIVDKNGYVDKFFNTLTDLSFLNLNSTQTQRVTNVILNLPIVHDTDLAVVDKHDGGQIFDDLQAVNILDINGRLDPFFSQTSDLSSLGLSAEDTATVRKILLDYPSLTTLGYPSSPSTGGITDIHSYRFAITRLTTSATLKIGQKLFAGGIDTLLDLTTQQTPVIAEKPFDRLKPTSLIEPDEQFATDGSQVPFTGPYGLYFWELFFHAPFLIASHLNANQQFKDAQKWYNYIFNPTAPEKFVAKNTFAKYTNDIMSSASETIYTALKNNNIVDANDRVEQNFTKDTDLSFLKLNANQTREVKTILWNLRLKPPTVQYWHFEPFRYYALETLQQMLTDSEAIKIYNDQPFDPHAIAGVRWGAYEKTIVMHYIDNLLDWGDYLFAQDSWESITAASLLYFYAYDTLGPRPISLGACKTGAPTTFQDIYNKYKDHAKFPDGIPQFLIELENLHTKGSASQPPSINLAGNPFNALDVYFCVPENDVFTSYWDRVEDRLFKIRHCMNIEGIVRQLALFQPAIDPMQLVKAAAAGNNV